MVNQFKLKPLAFAMSSVLLASSLAYAAEEDDSKKETDEEATEIIEVTGFRGSVLKSMLQKRNSGNVTDSIFAEDIGKSTDQNIADALSRVTGVSVQSQDGEGTLISVRGANPNMNVISLNGVQLTSPGENQSVDLSAFSSDILSHIDVVKTPSADHDEGSLGATVNLHTARPLSMNYKARRMQIQGRYNDFSENNDYKISGSFSDKFFDDRFGVLVTAYKETNSIRRDQMYINDWEVVDVARGIDTNNQLVNDFKAFMPEQLQYSLFQNERNRHGGTVTFELAPTDDTTIALDLTYGKADKVETFHNMTVRTRPDYANFVAGVEYEQLKVTGTQDNLVPEFSDPAEWMVVDRDTRTLVKAVQRFADGGYGRRNGGDESENKVANLEIKHYLTDNIMLDFGANYSSTELVLHQKNMGMLNGFVSIANLGQAGPYGDPVNGIQPAGLDCTSGTCEMVFGDGIVSHQDPINKFDSLAYTAFNPDDINAQSVNGPQFAITDRNVKDEIKSAYIDLDWDVDLLGVITKIEAGVKHTERSKFVDDQRTTFEQTSLPVVVQLYDSFGNVTGERTLREGSSIGDVPATNFASDEPFPYDNFMEDLGVPMSAATDGWPLVDEAKLLASSIGDENVQQDIKNLNTRSAELENSAAYLKLNFEPVEGLTGDVGVRYIKAKVNTSGYSGMNFTNDGLDRVYNPFTFAHLRDATLPTCAYDFNTPNGLGQGALDSRLDGLGWDRNGTPDDYTDDVRIPVNGVDPNSPDQSNAVYPCFDSWTLKSVAEHWRMWRHVDTSTAQFYRWGDDPEAIEDRSDREFPTQGDNEYDMYLPSFNLNWAVSNNFITRFATSKTISYPTIDDLKPGFLGNEGYWGNPGTTKGNWLRLSNPQLSPLESINLDLSFEWYFNETGLVSVGLFHKDMTNFVEEENAVVYLDDLRHVDLEGGYDAQNLIKSEAQILADLEDPDLRDGVGYQACMPSRGNIGDFGKDWWYSVEDPLTAQPADWLNYCALFNATAKRNGKGGNIKGIEFNYSQTYDFLPGIWSGLGSQINYTFQKSETDVEESSLVEGLKLPTMPFAWTPKHSYNATVFWEKFGHQIRLAYRGKSDELVNRNWNSGNLWQEGRGTVDISANYKINDMFTVGFNALNITDEPVRRYYTSFLHDFGDTQIGENGEVEKVFFNEGNALENSNAPTSRTQSLQKTGRIYRLTLNVKF